MIFGVGTDIVQVARIARVLERYGERFARRVLTEAEWGEFRAAPDPANFLARRFAAKEAAAKALGTGFANGVRFCDIGVTHDAAGRPGLVFYGATAALVSARGVTVSHVSLADEQDHAVAFVALETSG